MCSAKGMKIMLAVDLHGSPEHTLAAALPLLERLGERVDVVYLSEARMNIPAGSGAKQDVRYAEWQAARDKEEAAMKALMELIPEPIRGKGLIEPGVPRTALVSLSRDYDHVITGTRSPRGKLARLVLGSIADTLVREAHCTSTVIR
ncbi:MAG: nucleotide-binding universal stress UspA family protein [Myxococcota bacterium]